ncbi:DUF1152 domain-containing protein [Streptomyces sp. NBC_01276]|uniref:DUF1152 domain-containing protein n=1 Tax=Streptomyces sp. NBC_01276 TaxID=2903808 RepID=UPI00352DA07D
MTRAPSRRSGRSPASAAVRRTATRSSGGWTRTAARAAWAARSRGATRWCRADRLDLADVGGVIVARGGELTLRSPLGDALAVAARAVAEGEGSCGVRGSVSWGVAGSASV